MTPKELRYCVKGERIKQKIKDEEMWRMGIYVQAAVSVAVEHNLAGRKARSKYIERPFLQSVFEVKEKNTYKESQEEIAVFEMKQRIKALRMQGLPESPA